MNTTPLTSDGSGVLGGLTLGVVEVSGDGDDGIGDRVAQISLGRFLHLGQDHGGNFFGIEGLVLVLVLDLDLGLASVADDFERPMLHVRLDIGIFELATDQPFGV